MIDIRKALRQRCYILFDTNEQLRKFFEDNKLTPFVGVSQSDVIISVHLDGDLVTLPYTRLSEDIPTYHHTQLTYYDDGE